MLPALLGAGVVQINLLIDVILASTLPTGSVSYLYYADRLNQLPLAVIGIAIGTALLPNMSRNIQAGRLQEAKENQEKSLEIGLILTIPAAFGLMILSEPIVTALFQRGAFDTESAASTAIALVCYSAGLPAFVIIKIFQPNFFARHDTTTPVKIAASSVVINLILNLILMQYFAHAGLAMATSIAAWLSAAIFAIILKTRNLYSPKKQLFGKIIRIILAATVMGLGLVALKEISGDFAQSSSFFGICLLLLSIFCGGFIYFVSLFLFNGISKEEIVENLKRWSVRD